MGLSDRFSRLFTKTKEPSIKSATSDYPLPMDVFNFLIAKLEYEGGDFATFEDQDDEK